MRKILLILVSLLTVTAYGQNIGFRLDAGIGGAFSFGSLKSYGISASTEPKVLIGSNIAAGIRLEGDVLFGGTITDEASDLEVGLSSRAAILVKGEYYFTENNTRPFLGFGLGQYTIANTSASGTGSAAISAGNYFGLAPEVGITFGNFRISGIYHIVTGNPMVTVSSGSANEISANYLVIQLGFRVFGIGDR